MIEVYGGSTGVILRWVHWCLQQGCFLVEATEEPREANWFCQNLAIAMQQGNAFSSYSLSLYGEVLEARGSRGQPTPHFVPEGISSSMRDFIVLVFNFEVFNIQFS